MKDQLELSFEKAVLLHLEAGNQHRLRRARWWFDRMRQVVDRALDRHPRQPARPEQVYLALGE